MTRHSLDVPNLNAHLGVTGDLGGRNFCASVPNVAATDGNSRKKLKTKRKRDGIYKSSPNVNW